MVGGCDVFSTPPSCSTHKSAVFVPAWEEQLAKKGMIRSKKNENTLCFDNEPIPEIQET